MTAAISARSAAAVSAGLLVSGCVTSVAELRQQEPRRGGQRTWRPLAGRFTARLLGRLFR